MASFHPSPNSLQTVDHVERSCADSSPGIRQRILLGGMLMKILEAMCSDSSFPSKFHDAIGRLPVMLPILDRSLYGEAANQIKTAGPVGERHAVWQLSLDIHEIEKASDRPYCVALCR